MRATPRSRFVLLDAARGLAIAQMVVYHFLFDLGHFGAIEIDMYDDPRWIAWRSAIVAQFLFLMGASLALRLAPGAGPGWRRWAQIAACAVLVSIATGFVFGPRWIWFGVLHFAAAAQLLLLPLRRPLARLAPWLLALAGGALLAAGLTVHFPLFADDRLGWIGFSPVKPQTEDFVPLLPWLGVVLLGMAAMRAAGSRLPAPSARLAGRLSPLLAPLSAAGRWPLTIYMAHQPLLFGALYLLTLPRAA